MTNKRKILHKINTMSIEELAEFLVRYSCDDEDGFPLYTGDFEGTASNWDDAVKLELEWLKEDDEEIIDPGMMITVDGQNFRCTRCHANVFSKIKENNEIVYKCNSCGLKFHGE